LLVSDFDYHLPPDLIAQAPPDQRESSRMMIVRRDKGTFESAKFSDFPSFLGPGDCLVLNNTRVFPARLHGRRKHVDGAEVEVFLTRAKPGDETVWQALVRPAKRVRKDDVILFASDVRALVEEEGAFGERTLRFTSNAPLAEVFERLGSVPLPPYIRRTPDERDRERYQTVFAKKAGSVAAPTAGLHFTESSLARCRERGAEAAYVTLHVGLGTFAPLRERELSEIRLHEEYFEISAESAEAMRKASRRLCVGTTTVRTIETALLGGGLRQTQGETNLFISPGFTFRGTGAMLTNFHLPQSSLLILVSAFAGKDLTLAAYRYAVTERYRFFSYGDCMLIL
jgi:S-adenosylmethionine:tRNA ribosyltransferase-isomerase